MSLAKDNVQIRHDEADSTCSKMLYSDFQKETMVIEVFVDADKQRLKWSVSDQKGNQYMLCDDKNALVGEISKLQTGLYRKAVDIKKAIVYVGGFKSGPWTKGSIHASGVSVAPIKSSSSKDKDSSTTTTTSQVSTRTETTKSTETPRKKTKKCKKKKISQKL